MRLSFRYIFILVIVSSGLMMCSAPEEQEQTVPGQRPTQESWDSEIYLTELGERHATIQAGHLAQYEDKEMVILNEDVKTDFFRENKHSSTLVADSAVVFRNTNVMRAFGQVVVESDSGITLYTERLAYDPDTEKITADTAVTLTTETDTLHGIGFESNSDLTEWVITQPRGVTRREFGE